MVSWNNCSWSHFSFSLSPLTFSLSLSRSSLGLCSETWNEEKLTNGLIFLKFRPLDAYFWRLIRTEALPLAHYQFTILLLNMIFSFFLHFFSFILFYFFKKINFFFQIWSSIFIGSKIPSLFSYKNHIFFKAHKNNRSIKGYLWNLKIWDFVSLLINFFYFYLKCDHNWKSLCATFFIKAQLDY